MRACLILIGLLGCQHAGGTLLEASFRLPDGAPEPVSSAGVRIARVHPHGPAARAGLRPGDVLFELNGSIVTDPQAVRVRLLHQLGLGASCRLRYARDGQLLETDLVPEERSLLVEADDLPRIRMPPPPSTSYGPEGGQVEFTGRFYVDLDPSREVTSPLVLTSPSVDRVVIPPRGGYPRQVAFRVAGPGIAQLGPGWSITSFPRGCLSWTEGSQLLTLSLGPTPEGSDRLASRWRGWGMRLEDYERDRVIGWERKWARHGFWGFSAPGLPESVPLPDVPARAVRDQSDAVRILLIEPGGCAERAGLLSGDVIVSVLGKPVRHPGELHDLMAASFPDQEVPILFRRGGQARQATLHVDVAIPRTVPRMRQPVEGPPAPGPVVTSRGGVHRLTVRRPFRFHPTLFPALYERITASARTLSQQEIPATARSRRRLSFLLTGSPAIRLSDGTVIRGTQPVRILWDEGGATVKILPNAGPASGFGTGPGPAAPRDRVPKPPVSPDRQRPAS